MFQEMFPDYRVVDDELDYFTKLYKSLEKREKLYIPTDSKRVAIFISQFVNRAFPNLKVMIVYVGSRVDKENPRLDDYARKNNCDVLIYSTPN